MRSDLADRSLRTAADRPLRTAADRPRVLVILDGASEPLRAGEPTSLERAATPALDALCRDGGTLTRVRTVAPWLAPGSESAIPALLGWTPPSAVDRGAVEAAAWEVDGWERLGEVAAGERGETGERGVTGERAWRVDVRAGDGSRADAGAVAAAAALLTETRPRHRVIPLAGHRLLVIGSDPLSGDGGRVIAPPLADTPSDLPGHSLHIWPEGVVPPRLLDERTVVVSARGAAAGIGRLMGARVVVPDGATGRPGSDLAGKARAAVAAIEAGAARVVVHVGGPDEAAHELDSDGKVAAIEAADRDVIGPLIGAVRAAGALLRVCPDHGCDPRDGHHDAEPVPCLEWRTGDTPRDGGSGRLTECAVAGRPVVELAAPLGAGDGAHAQIGASA